MFALLAMECFSGTFDFCSDSYASGFLSCFGPHVHTLPVSPDLVTPQYLLLGDPPLVTASTSTQLPFLKPRAWQTPYVINLTRRIAHVLIHVFRFFNFDNFAQSLKVVLLMSTNMYWPNIMYSAVDSTTSVQAPIEVVYFHAQSCLRLSFLFLQQRTQPSHNSKLYNSW